MILWLADQARARMLREADRYSAVETGGGLFGYATDDAIVIEELGIAAGMSRRTPITFSPDPEDLQNQIDRVIAQSAGRR